MPPNAAARELGNLREMLDKKLNMGKFKEAIAGIAGGRDDQKKEAQTMMKANKNDPMLRSEIRKHGQQHLDGFDRAVNQSPVEFNRWFDDFAKAIGKPETTTPPAGGGGTAHMTFDGTNLTGAGIAAAGLEGTTATPKEMATQLTDTNTQSELLAAIKGDKKAREAIIGAIKDKEAIQTKYKGIKAALEKKSTRTPEEEKDLEKAIQMIGLLEE
jgi:hypothetical protein